MRILVVDDETELADLIARGLRGEGHDPIEAHDGIAAITAAQAEHLDLAVVDVMLPGMSGFELCRRLKEIDPTTGIILLTARDAVDDRVRGLDAGADDYMVKPFAFAELAARVRAVRRRDALVAPRELQIGDLRIDLVRDRVNAGETEVRLSRTEFDLLRALALRAGDTVPRPEILAEVWQSEHLDANVVDQYISYLRRKLEQSGTSARILTTRGVGFVLVGSA